jgi:hypothetical protein
MGVGNKRPRNTVTHRLDGVTELVLTYKRKSLICLFDTADYPLVKDYRWHAAKHDKGFYAETSSSRPQVRMHVLLLPVTGDGMTADHKDWNGLNNCRSNLRYADQSQQNVHRQDDKYGRTSRFRGVCRYGTLGKFKAEISFRGAKKHLGVFDSEIDAAKAYNRAATEIHGQFANLNSISSEAFQ